MHITFLLCRNMVKTHKLILHLKNNKAAATLWPSNTWCRCDSLREGRCFTWQWSACRFTTWQSIRLQYAAIVLHLLFLALESYWLKLDIKQISSDVLSKQNVIGKFVEVWFDWKCFVGKTCLNKFITKAFKNFWSTISTGLTVKSFRIFFLYILYTNFVFTLK